VDPAGGDKPGDAADDPAEEEGAETRALLPVAHATDCRLRLVICTVGDLLLDVVVRLEGPLAADTDAFGRTRIAPGGQAGNVAVWVAALGGRARAICKRGRDAGGRILADELARRGVDLRGPEVENGTGVVVSIAGPNGRRAMLTDRGVAPSLEPEEVDPGWFAGCSWLHIPGYGLVATPLRDAVTAAADYARSAGARVSVDLSSTAAIERVGADSFLAEARALAPDLVFANEEELALVPELEAETMVIKRGARGCAVHRTGVVEERAALPADVVDTTGAGDAFAAGFLLGGVEAALAAAARCVARIGAVP
jgi:ribokinase